MNEPINFEGDGSAGSFPWRLLCERDDPTPPRRLLPLCLGHCVAGRGAQQGKELLNYAFIVKRQAGNPYPTTFA